MTGQPQRLSQDAEGHLEMTQMTVAWLSLSQLSLNHVSQPYAGCLVLQLQVTPHVEMMARHQLQRQLDQTGLALQVESDVVLHPGWQVHWWGCLMQAAQSR